MKFAYTFVSFTNQRFAIVAEENVDGAELQQLASDIHERHYGAGTNDKFHGPVNSLPCFE